jgi:hypothetical protein
MISPQRYQLDQRENTKPDLELMRHCDLTVTPTTMPLPLLPPSQPSLTTSSPSPSSPVLAVPLLENADDVVCGTSAHSIGPTTVLSPPIDKPYDLRCEREEEVMDSETTSKWCKLMPNSILLSLPTVATPVPVPKIVSIPKITKAQKVVEAIVLYARNLALYPQYAP